MTQYRKPKEQPAYEIPDEWVASAWAGTGIIGEEFTTIGQQIQDRIDGKKAGWGLYYPELENKVGRLEKGFIFSIGGYSGIGKSYFAMNLVENLLGEAEPPHIAVFSTELSKIEYVKRLLFLRLGLYETSFRNYPFYYEKQVKEGLDAMQNDIRIASGLLQVYGDVLSMENIHDILTMYEVENLPKPEVLVIDWIQQLSVEELYNEKDAMPLLARKIKELAINHGVAVIVVSQINNYAQNKEFNQASSSLSAFSYGKELNQISDVAITLTRYRAKSQMSKHLQAHITKSRRGMTGIASFRIDDGYKLTEITNEDGQAIDMALGGGDAT